MSKDYAKAHVCFRLIKMNTFSHNGPDRDQTFFFFFFFGHGTIHIKTLMGVFVSGCDRQIPGTSTEWTL